MFRSIGIRIRLTIGLCAAVAAILVLQVMAYRNVQLLAQANERDSHAAEVIIATEAIATSLLRMQSAAPGLRPGSGNSAPDLVENENRRRRDAVARALELTSGRPAQQDRLRRLAVLGDDWVRRAIHPLIDARRTSAGALGASRQPVVPGDPVNAPGLAALRTLVSEIAREENEQLQLRRLESQKMRAASRNYLFGAGVAAILLGGVLILVVRRAILRPVAGLCHAIAAISAGDYSARAGVLSDDEMGRLTREFNRMAQIIENRHRVLAENAQQLDARIDALRQAMWQAASPDFSAKVDVVGEDAVGLVGEGLAAMLVRLRQLGQDVRRACTEVTSASTEIATAVKQYEANAIGQAHASVDISSTTQEIATNSRELLTTIKGAAGVAQYTTAATADVQAKLKRLDETMQDMAAATQGITAKLATLFENASNINGVLTTIAKVADQTSILSLNAAIEAERAGEAGRGFAVIAGEIRRLADQTSGSTLDIEQTVREMQSAVSVSVASTDEFAGEIRRSVDEVRQLVTQLSTVMEQVRTLAPQFEQVLEGMHAQVAGAQQISEAICQLSESNLENTYALKTTTAAVQRLQITANNMRSTVATFATG